MTSALDFVPEEEEITVEYEAGTSKQVNLHDGSSLLLSKLNPDWDPTNRRKAHERLQASRETGEVLTGLVYIDPSSQDLHQVLQTAKRPLNTLKQEDLCPGQAALNKINAGLR